MQTLHGKMGVPWMGAVVSLSLMAMFYLNGLGWCEYEHPRTGSLRRAKTETPFYSLPFSVNTLEARTAFPLVARLGQMSIMLCCIMIFCRTTHLFKQFHR